MRNNNIENRERSRKANKLGLGITVCVWSSRAIRSDPIRQGEKNMDDKRKQRTMDDDMMMHQMHDKPTDSSLSQPNSIFSVTQRT